MARKRIRVSCCGLLFLVLSSLSIGEAGILRGEPAAETRKTEPIDPRARAGIRRAYAGLPLFFEANRGQADPVVRYLSRGPGYTLFFTPGETVASFLARGHADRNAPSSAVVRIRYIGANTHPRVKGLDPLQSKAHYFLGNDPGKWRSRIPLFKKVKYPALYPGIDLVYYGRRGRLEFDFRVAPFADPAVIRLGIQGAEGVEIDPEGRVIIRLKGGAVIQEAPVVFQVAGGVKTSIDGGYRIHSAGTTGDPSEVVVGFKTGEYDPSRTLIIDPVLSYATYLGGISHAPDFGYGIAVDGSGCAYVTGEAGSPNFPLSSSPLQTDQGGTDAFVTKFDASGSALVYSTYLGGERTDIGRGIAVDASGCAYVTGETFSENFPTQNPFQDDNSGYTRLYGDAFVTKLHPLGLSLVYSTYLHGTPIGGRTVGYGIAVDGSGCAYVTGETGSANFPLSSSPLQSDQGGTDAFVTKFDASGSALVYSTYLGGGGTDIGHGIAADASGNAYVTGETGSTDFPTAGLIQAALSGTTDVFVTKVSPSGFTMVYSTYLGGTGADSGRGIAVDSQRKAAYVAGQTESYDFPTQDPFQTATYDDGDAFVARIGEADIAVSPTTIVFCRRDVGASSSPMDATVTNNGVEALSLGQISITGTDAAHFGIQGDTCSGEDLEPGGSCSFQVVYAPLAEGSKSAAVAIPFNGPGMPTESVTLSSHPLGITICCTNSDVSDVAVSDEEEGRPPGTAVQEAVRFTLTGVPGTADIIMAFATLPEDRIFWKVVNGVWTEFYPENRTQGITNVSLVGNTLFFTIEDNSDCDADPAVGVIRDPLVVGTPVAGSKTRAVDTGGGCFISTLEKGPRVW